MRPIQSIRFAFLLVTCFFSSTVMAQLSGVYVGIQGAISQSDADYSKVLDNTHPDNATTVAGMRFETSNTGDGNLGNIGLVVGYRKALDSGFYGVQLEANTGSGRVSGFVSGDGVSQLRAQYGEAWPETFDVASSTEFGVTLQWGRELLDTNWTAITGYYFLIGAKRANVELDTRYELGCFTLTECVGPQFETGEFSYEASGQVYAFGGGVEHAFSEKFVAQLELRLETSIEDDWEDVYENGTVRVIPSLEMQNFRFTLSLSRFL